MLSSVKRHTVNAFVLFLTLCAVLGACKEEGSFEPKDFQWLDRPVPFLSKSKNLSEIVLEPEGLEFLRKIKTPVSIVTFIGMSRSGKSFSIDHLLGIDPYKGFKVGHTINPETRGAELWGRPINMHFLGSKQNRTSVLILDTEGLGASLSNYDKSILFFSVLMSSRVVYHLNENINNDDITRLYSIINLVEMFKKEKISTVNLPYISWVVQRFTLGLPAGYTPLDVLFKKKLVEIPNPTNDEGISQFNETVRVVRSEFRDHSVFFIPPASKNVDDYVRLPDMKPSELNLGYRKKMSELRDLILSTRPKRLGNTEDEMTGETLADFITGLIPEVNKGTPYMGDRVLEGIAKGLLEKCKREYALEIKKIDLPLDIPELETYDIAARETANRCFDEGMIGRPDSYVKSSYKALLGDEIQYQFDFLMENNTHQSGKVCSNVTRMITDRAMKSDRVGTAHDGYIDELMKEATGLLRGPKKAACLVEIRSDLNEILNSKKISLLPSRVDRLLIIVIGTWFVLYFFGKYAGVEAIHIPVALFGIMLGCFKFTNNVISTEKMLEIIDTLDEIYYVAATYWQVIPFALVFLLVFCYTFEPSSPRKVARELKARITKGHQDEDVIVEFWRNCSKDGKVVSEVAKKLIRRDKVVVLVGWRHYFGLRFLPRSNLVHVVCSGKSDAEEDVRKAFNAAVGVIAEDASDEMSTSRSGDNFVAYVYNLKASLISSDNETKEDIIDAINQN